MFIILYKMDKDLDSLLDFINNSTPMVKNNT